MHFIKWLMYTLCLVLKGQNLGVKAMLKRLPYTGDHKVDSTTPQCPDPTETGKPRLRG